MIKVKLGVDFSIVAPSGFLILDAIKKASKELNLDLTITSACDGVHSGVMDPHHLGEAYDIRSHDFIPDMKTLVLNTIMANLNESFYGFLESPNTDNEHFHIQRKKGTIFTIEQFLMS